MNVFEQQSPGDNKQQEIAQILSWFKKCKPQMELALYDKAAVDHIYRPTTDGYEEH